MGKMKQLWEEERQKEQDYADADMYIEYAKKQKRGNEMKTFKRIEEILSAKFELEEVQEEMILASNFLIIWIAFDEISPGISHQGVEDLLNNASLEYGNINCLSETERTDNPDGSGHIKFIFRKDDEEELDEWKYHQYEEAIRQEKWF